jgi:hypothetical protein
MSAHSAEGTLREPSAEVAPLLALVAAVMVPLGVQALLWRAGSRRYLPLHSHTGRRLSHWPAPVAAKQIHRATSRADTHPWQPRQGQCWRNNGHIPMIMLDRQEKLCNQFRVMRSLFRRMPHSKKEVSKLHAELKGKDATGNRVENENVGQGTH